MSMFGDIGSIANSITTKANGLDTVLKSAQISAAVLSQLQPLLNQITDTDRPLSSIMGDLNRLMGGQGNADSVKAMKLMKVMTDIASLKTRLQELEEELDELLDEARRPAKSEAEAMRRMMQDLGPGSGDTTSDAVLQAQKRQQQLFEMISTMMQKSSDMQKSAIGNMR
jgi:ABC-type transporter Mla subunit MlaD